VDKSSPLLFSHCVTGKHIPEATLFVRRAGGKALDYLKVNIKQVLVSSISSGAGSDNDRVEESVSLNFAEIKVEYTPQKEDGTGLGPIIKGYNVAKNIEI
jgi:type VI secretion system secreted protein Hcp